MNNTLIFGSLAFLASLFAFLAWMYIVSRCENALKTTALFIGAVALIVLAKQMTFLLKPEFIANSLLSTVLDFVSSVLILISGLSMVKMIKRVDKVKNVKEKSKKSKIEVYYS